MFHCLFVFYVLNSNSSSGFRSRSFWDIFSKSCLQRFRWAVNPIFILVVNFLSKTKWLSMLAEGNQINHLVRGKPLSRQKAQNAHFRPPLSNFNYYSVYEECCQTLFCWITKLCSQQREKNITDLYNQHDHRMSWICTKIPNISHFIMLFTGFLCCLFYSKQCIHLFII